MSSGNHHHRKGTTTTSSSPHHPPNPEIFAEYFEHWLQEQHRDLQSLRSAAASSSPSQENEHEQQEEEDRLLRPLVDLVLSHYDTYYRTKSASARRDVLPMFSPSWTSSTENLFLWVGGWLPSAAFHLLYSKSGLQLEPNLSRLINGLCTHDLSDLSHDQLSHIDQLQMKTIQQEKEISEEEAKVQETVADAKMVELAEEITEADGEGAERMGPEMVRKQEGMEKVLERADRLRMETLKGVVEILRPMQAVHFLIAAAELHLRVHEFGKRKDEQRAAEGGG